MSGRDTPLLPAMPGSPAAAASLRWPARLRLMAVHAHPDDESSKGAATMARYVHSGVDVMVCTLTGGERGDILNKAMERPEIRANLSSIRRQEMARAREILGVGQQFLGFVDSGLPEGDPLPPLPEGCFALQKLEDAAEPLVRAVREFRPHVMLTYDENGGYPHPDHLKTHQVSVHAFDAAADPDRYPGSGEPWQPLKLYYFVSFHKARFTALHEEMERRGLQSPYQEWFRRWDDQEWFRRWDDQEWFRRWDDQEWFRRWDDQEWFRRWDDQEWFRRWDRQDRAATRPRLQITSRVPCADFFAVRDQALLAHATQIDPASSWFACPVEVRQAAWPTEDYHLARSLVNTELPENDLFAGVRETLPLSAAGTPGGRVR